MDRIETPWYTSQFDTLRVHLDPTFRFVFCFVLFFVLFCFVLFCFAFFFCFVLFCFVFCFFVFENGIIFADLWLSKMFTDRSYVRSFVRKCLWCFGRYLESVFLLFYVRHFFFINICLWCVQEWWKFSKKIPTGKYFFYRMVPNGSKK